MFPKSQARVAAQRKQVCHCATKTESCSKSNLAKAENPSDGGGEEVAARSLCRYDEKTPFI